VPEKKINFYPVVLAGGRGTRFWPLSRKHRAKQLLALDGKHTMIQQTVARLRPLAPASHLWVITNEASCGEITKQLPSLNKKQILAEPVGRNTAPAIGLAAFILLQQDCDAVIGMFPSDHVIANEDRYREVLKHGIKLATTNDNIVVLGVQPTRPETGYGYIEAGYPGEGDELPVRCFKEKPDADTAIEFLNAGNFYWNSGMFLWRAQTLVNALREHLPDTAALLEQIAGAFGTRKFEATFRKLYPRCKNISIDYAVLEPRSGKGEKDSHIFCLVADFGWNDLGSWTALHEHQVAKGPAKDGNILCSAGGFTLNAEGNYVHAPGKFVATVGVNDLIVVETEDALLITTRRHSQDVGKVVKYLDDKKKTKLT
jgi:mannose-1-phosphate guanylyltransferase